MSIFGGGSSQAAQAPVLTGISIQTSVLGKAVPLCYGATRIAGNLIWYGDFSQNGGQSSSPNGQSGGPTPHGKGGGGGGGGKGGGKGGSGQQNSSASVAIGICEGPITGYNVLFNNKQFSLVSGTFTEFLGTYPQSPWQHLATNFPAQALGYSGLAYVAAQNLQLSGGAQLPNFNFEVLGILYGSAPSTYGGNAHVTLSGNQAPTVADVTGGDADPSRVAVDLLTNPLYGAGFPTSRVGQVLNTFENHTIPASGPFTVQLADVAVNLWIELANLCVVFAATDQLLTCVLGSPGPGQYAVNLANGTYTFNAADAGKQVVIRFAALFPFSAMPTYQAYALASGLWISPAYTDQTATSQILDDLAKFTNSEWVWSSGVLTMVPRGAVAISANGVSYAPPGAPLFNLTDDDFLPNTGASGASASTSEDPVLLTRKRPADQMNDIKIECLDRANFYNTAIVEAYDQGLIDRYGRRTTGSQSAHFFCDVNAANTSAQLLLQREYIRNTYQFTLDQRYCVLDPMDIVTLTDAALGLNQVAVRITEITENDDGTLSIVAEEYPALLGTPPLYSFQTNAPFVADYNADPGLANPPVILEPPFQLAGAEEVWILASGGANWGGAQVWISSDGQTYVNGGTITGQGRTGALTAALPAVAAAARGPTIDQADTLAVSIAQSVNAQLLSGSQADAIAGNTLCYVDGELISYATAALGASAGLYNLSYLVRGMYGSPIGSHAAGAAFARIPSSPLGFTFTPDRIGQTVHVKLLSFNQFGGGLQSLASVPSYSYTIRGLALAQPLPNVTSLQQGVSVNNAVEITWSPLTDPLNIRTIDYEIRFGANAQTAQMLGRTANTFFVVPSDGTYWVAAHYRTPQGLDVYSAAFQSINVTIPINLEALLATYFGETASPGLIINGHQTMIPPWTGTFGGAATVVNNALTLDAAGNYLTDVTDVIGDQDILFGLGGVQSSGSLWLNPGGFGFGFNTPQSLLPVLSYTLVGQSIYDNFLTVPNIFADDDVLLSVIGQAASFQLQYGFGSGSTGIGMPSQWFNWQPGQQIALAAAVGAGAPLLFFQVVLQTSNPIVQPILSHLTLQVYAMEKVQSTANMPTILTGQTIWQFPIPYSSKPTLNVTFSDLQPGDVVTYNLGGGAVGLPFSSVLFYVQSGVGGAFVLRHADIQAIGI